MRDLLLALCALIALVFAACGSTSDRASSGSAQPSSSTVVAAAAKLVSGGVLKVGGELDIPPDVYLPAGGSKRPVGAEVDLMDALGRRLGFKTEYVNIAFDGLVPALKAKRFDVIMSQLGDFTDRQQAVDLVDYAKLGEGLITRTADKASHVTASSFCGQKVGAAKGTVAVKLVSDISKKCRSAGKPPVERLVFPEDNSAVLALRSGRIDGSMIDMHTAADQTRKLQGGEAIAIAVPNVLAGIPLGIALPKSATALRDALAAELNKMIADGSYRRILAKWGITDSAVAKATINGGTTSAG